MKTKEKESPSQIKTFQARGKKVASTAITTTQQLLILLLSTKFSNCGSKQGERWGWKKQKEKSWKTSIEMNIKISIHITG